MEKKRKVREFCQSEKVGTMIIANFVFQSCRPYWFQFLSNDTAKTKLAILAFLYCGEFVKTPNENVLREKALKIMWPTKRNNILCACKVDKLPNFVPQKGSGRPIEYL